MIAAIPLLPPAPAVPMTELPPAPRSHRCRRDWGSRIPPRVVNIPPCRRGRRLPCLPSPGPPRRRLPSPPLPNKMPPRSAVAAGTAGSDRVAAGTAVAEPADRHPGAAVIAVAAVADQTAIIVAGPPRRCRCRRKPCSCSRCRTGSAVRVVGGAVTDERPDQVRDRVAPTAAALGLLTIAAGLVVFTIGAATAAMPVPVPTGIDAAADTVSLEGPAIAAGTRDGPEEERRRPPRPGQ